MNKGSPITVLNYTNEYLEIMIRRWWWHTQGLSVYSMFSLQQNKMPSTVWAHWGCDQHGAWLDRFLLCSLKHMNYMWHILKAVTTVITKLLYCIPSLLSEPLFFTFIPQQQLVFQGLSTSFYTTDWTMLWVQPQILCFLLAVAPHS